MDIKDKPTFLQKFKGKTNVMGKQGISHLIQQSEPQEPPTSTARRPSGMVALIKSIGKGCLRWPRCPGP